LKKDGTEFPIEAHGKMFSYKGKQVRVTAIRDITQQKKAEKEIKESRQMLQTVLDTMPLLVFWKDVDGNYMGGNQLFIEFAGFKTPEELIGKSDLASNGFTFSDIGRIDMKGCNQYHPVACCAPAQ
jgi:PAS domain-containing protein